MLLPTEEAKRYHAIYPSLLQFAVARAAPESKRTELLSRLKVRILSGAVEARDILFSNPDLISAFVRENPAGLDSRDLFVVRSWTTFRKGRFVILRSLRYYAVFLSEEKPSTLYGVLGLFSKAEQMLGAGNMPALVETVLLPWEGRIIHDGFFQPYGVTFGPGIRRDMQEEFTRLKETRGIVTSFDAALEPSAGTAGTSSQGFDNVTSTL